MMARDKCDRQVSRTEWRRRAARRRCNIIEIILGALKHLAFWRNECGVSHRVKFTPCSRRQQANVATGPNHNAAAWREQSLLLRIELAGDLDKSIKDCDARFTSQCDIHAELGTAHG